MAELLLEAHGLGKAFGGIVAVSSVDLSLEKGETLGIVGPNGAGKTTLFNLLSGAIRPDSGRILFGGRDISRLGPEARAELGLVRTFQAGRAFANLTIEENILVGAHRERLASRTGGLGFGFVELLEAFLPLPQFHREEKALAQRAGALAATFGERLAPRFKNPAYSLSYANRRRVEIARALAAQPLLLLLDEPTAGMNPSETAEMLEYLKRLKQAGLSMIVIEHKLPLIMQLSDRVIAMDEGEKAAEGKPLDVAHNARVIEAYLGTAKASPHVEASGGKSGPAALDANAAGSLQADSRVVTTGSGAQSEAEASFASFEGWNEVASEKSRTAASAGGESLATPQALLSLRSIDSYYGPVQVHHSLSLEVGEGEIVCLLGGNASGKSTAMKVILGLLSPRAGDILWRGQPITRTATSERIKLGLASVPEARRVFPEMTVEENIGLGAYVRTGLSQRGQKAAVREDFARVLELFPRLAERRSQLAGTMSGGEQQMLAIARALMSRPKLICMDEPTMGLSPLFVENVLGTIQNLNKTGLSVFMVEQSAHQALGIAHRGYVLQNGRLVLQGSARDLVEDPRIRDAYLGGEQMGGI